MNTSRLRPSGAAAASGEPAGPALTEAGPPFPPPTSPKESIGVSRPSTRSRKSFAVKPETRRPPRSITTASTLTTRTSIEPLKVSGTGAGGCAAKGEEPARKTAKAKPARRPVIESIVPSILHGQPAMVQPELRAVLAALARVMPGAVGAYPRPVEGFLSSWQGWGLSCEAD